MASLLFSVTSDHQDASVYWEAISCAEQASLINSSAGFKAQTEPAEITEWNNICYDVIKHVNGLLGGTGACPADRQGVCVCVWDLFAWSFPVLLKMRSVILFWQNRREWKTKLVSPVVRKSLCPRWILYLAELRRALRLCCCDCLQ